MAGKNIVQKILARAAGKESVETGDFLHIRSNCMTNVGGDGDPTPMQAILDPAAPQGVFDPKKICIVVGHAGAGGNPRTVGDYRGKVKKWAKAAGIPRENIVDLGAQGVEHVVAGEKAWALPWEVYLSIIDGHTTSLGALGCFPVALSSGSAEYLV